MKKKSKRESNKKLHLKKIAAYYLSLNLPKPKKGFLLQRISLTGEPGKTFFVCSEPVIKVSKAPYWPGTETYIKWSFKIMSKVKGRTKIQTKTIPVREFQFDYRILEPTLIPVSVQPLETEE
jgi:hypothetical protein